MPETSCPGGAAPDESPVEKSSFIRPPKKALDAVPLTKTDENLIEVMLKEGYEVKVIADLFRAAGKGSRTSIYLRTGRFRKVGSVKPQGGVGGRPKVITDDERDFIFSLIRTRDSTLLPMTLTELSEEIANRFNTKRTTTSISRLLKASDVASPPRGRKGRLGKKNRPGYLTSSSPAPMVEMETSDTLTTESQPSETPSALPANDQVHGIDPSLGLMPCEHGRALGT